MLYVIIAACLCGGCVERRLSISSNVTGSRIFVDGEYVGDAPVDITFKEYGRREWTARADGYEVANGDVVLDTPWYEYPPMDFFIEVLWPGTVEDKHCVNVVMAPLKPPQSGGLYDRALANRKESRADIARHSVSPSATPPAPGK